VECQLCGEEILNEREVVHSGMTLCRACAGEQYYIHSPGRPIRTGGPQTTLSVKGNPPSQR
jgi:ribosome-binding protein aMBF1 (putative translation factor)